MNTDSIDWQAVLGPEIFGSMGSELPELQAGVLGHSPRAIRLTRAVDPVGLPFATSQVPWFSNGRYVAEPNVRPGQFLQHAAGDYYVQDAGSMLALALCDVQPGQIVCDACAAPGGKSTGLLEQLDGCGALVANEVTMSRLAPLRLALARSGMCNYLLTNHELGRLAELYGSSFHCVLVDAPCTGQSMVVRGKQSMSAFLESQICHSSARQRKIIEATAKLVKPGGRMVYSTCTFSWAENEQIIREFLATHPGWKILRFPELHAWECSHEPGCYRLWPHRDRAAGAFAAALQKLEEPRDACSPIHSRFASPRWRPLSRSCTVPAWLTAAEADSLYRYEEEVHRFPSGIDSDWIANSRAGSPVAQLKSTAHRSQTAGRKSLSEQQRVRRP